MFTRKEIITKLSPLPFLLIMLWSCRNPEGTRVNKFADTVLIKIADFQDRRLPDSLYPYFENNNPQYRRDAVSAFASIQDTVAIEKIGSLLERDKNAEVRKAAAFALGQTGGVQASRLLEARISIEPDAIVLHEIMEAYGKTGTPHGPYLSKWTSGDPWMNYRFGLRGLANVPMIEECIKYLEDNGSQNTHLGAAHFFARGAKEIEVAERVLRNIAIKDSSAEVRMAAAIAFRKIKTDSSLHTLNEVILHDADYRVRVNGVKGLQAFSFNKTKKTLFHALDDANLNVAVASSEIIKANATKEFWSDLVAKARATKTWRVQANLYEAALAAIDHKELVEEIFILCKKSTSPYQKAALITALQHSVMAYGFVAEQLLHADIPVIKSSAASALVEINKLKGFDPSLKKTFVDTYIKAIQSGDLAVIGIIAGGLADATLDYKNLIKDFSFLYAAKKKLSLPKDNEALQSLEFAIAYFEGKNQTEVKNSFNHPIDWPLVKTIPRDQKAIIKTSKGNITIQLFVEEAPGSVANFVHLANKNYFDHKLFHRVVPNFVVQGGCNRGDGWGSEDYSIRSEFSGRRYKTGSIGMASAGKDTEGTQWFITHSPTPHLDGRYTIFAEVIEGMNVVHTLEIGDEILAVVLQH